LSSESRKRSQIEPRLLLNVNRKSYHLPWSSASAIHRKGPKWPSAGRTVSPPSGRCRACKCIQYALRQLFCGSILPVMRHSRDIPLELVFGSDAALKSSLHLINPFCPDILNGRQWLRDSMLSNRPFLVLTFRQSGAQG